MISVRPGRPFPLGASLTNGGVHFALVSRNAHRVWLQLYDDPEAWLERAEQLDEVSVADLSLVRRGDRWLVQTARFH